VVPPAKWPVAVNRVNSPTLSVASTGLSSMLWSGPSTVMTAFCPESLEPMPLTGSTALIVTVPGPLPVVLPRSSWALLTDAIAGSLLLQSTFCV
jgi:hypothetical protein